MAGSTLRYRPMKNHDAYLVLVTVRASPARSVFSSPLTKSFSPSARIPRRLRSTARNDGQLSTRRSPKIRSHLRHATVRARSDGPADCEQKTSHAWMPQKAVYRDLPQGLSSRAKPSTRCYIGTRSHLRPEELLAPGKSDSPKCSTTVMCTGSRDKPMPWLFQRQSYCALTCICAIQCSRAIAQQPQLAI